MESYKLAKSSEGSVSKGQGLIADALKQATTVPLGVAERAAEIATIVRALQPITNPNMKSDLTTAIALAKAALEGALANVEINLESIKDEVFVQRTRQQAGSLRS